METLICNLRGNWQSIHFHFPIVWALSSFFLKHTIRETRQIQKVHIKIHLLYNRNSLLIILSKYGANYLSIEIHC